MNQSLLNFDVSLARKSDPETSHVVAADVAPKIGRLHLLVLSAAETMGEADFTAQEVARTTFCMYGGCQETYRKRVGELVVSGRLIAKDTRICSVSGKLARAFVLNRGISV